MSDWGTPLSNFEEVILAWWIIPWTIICLAFGSALVFQWVAS